jgi:hypothetical protein
LKFKNTAPALLSSWIEACPLEARGSVRPAYEAVIAKMLVPEGAVYVQPVPPPGEMEPVGYMLLSRRRPTVEPHVGCDETPASLTVAKGCHPPEESAVSLAVTHVRWTYVPSASTLDGRASERAMAVPRVASAAKRAGLKRCKVGSFLMGIGSGSGLG